MNASTLQESMERAIRKCREESEDGQMISKKKVDDISVLTDDVLFDILRRLPPVILRYKTRFVCKRWFNIITNRILKEHASFIIQRSSGLYTACEVIIREEKEGLEFQQQYLDIPYRGRIKSWCNEFLLIVDPNRRESVLVFNLITNEGVYLPWCRTSCGGHYTSKCGVALAFDGFKEVYKAVHIFMGPSLQCKIIVLKRDITASRVSTMWKRIQVPSYDMGEGQYYWGNPVSVQGRYFHWDVHCSKYLVSIDMVKEKIFQIPLPECNDDRVGGKYSLVEMGGVLALLDNDSWNHADLWILKDFRRMKWEKLHSIRAPSYVRTGIYPPIFMNASPVCSVISKRYLIVKKSRTNPGLVSYDLENQVVKELNIHCGDSEHCVVHSAAPSFL